MKTLAQHISLVFVAVTLSLPSLAGAQGQSPRATAATDSCDEAMLSAVAGLVEAHLVQTRHALDILARTAEVRSGQWEKMEQLVRAAVPVQVPQVFWFVRPDGTYYTSAKGLADQKLADRPYFPKLMAGEAVVGDMVVSKSTSKKSFILAVPVSDGGKVVGGVGASIFADDLSFILSATLTLPPNAIFYGLATNGITTFHVNPKLDFVDPRRQESPSLAQAVQEMLSRPFGEVTYEFGGSTRQVHFTTSPLTGWRIVYGRMRETAATAPGDRGAREGTKR